MIVDWTRSSVCVRLVFVHGVEVVDGIVLHVVDVLDCVVKAGHSRVVRNAFAGTIGLVLILALA